MIINDMMFKAIEKYVDENIDEYNMKLLNDSSKCSVGLDKDDWFDYVFAIHIMRFIFKSFVERDDDNGNFKLKTFIDEESDYMIPTISGNFKTKTFDFKDTFFVNFLPSIYVPILYKHRAYVEQCIIYIDEKYKKLDD